MIRTFINFYLYFNIEDISFYKLISILRLSICVKVYFFLDVKEDMKILSTNMRK